MSSQKPIRKWPAIVVLVLDILAVIYVNFFLDSTQQNRVLLNIMIQFFAVFGLVIWFVLLSRLPLKIRMLGGLAFVVVLGALSQMVVIRDFSGDMLPKLAWKWTPRHDETLDASSKIATEAITVVATDKDYPRFLGASGTPVMKGLNLARDWNTQKPNELWRIEIGAGWSGFATIGDLAVTQEQRGEEEMVTCYKISTGEQVWAHGDKIRLETSLGGNGPRSTPTIANGKVYTLGGTGYMNCLNLTTGEVIWSRDLEAEHNGHRPEWGHSCSPLVYNDLVIVSIGGPNGHSLVAHNAETGEPVWSAGDDEAGYSSPFVHEVGGVPQILIFTSRAAMGHDPTDGKVLWDFPFGEGTPNVANPLPVNEYQVLVSSGYGIGSALLNIKPIDGKLTMTEQYQTNRMKAKFANFVAHEGAIYGLDDGVLASMDIATGDRNWKRGRYGHGQLILVDDLLLVQGERGGLYLIPANPEKPEVTGEIQVLDNKCWNNMALSGNKLIMRNHKEAVCLELPLAN